MSRLTFRILRIANEMRLPLFKNNKGVIAHPIPDGSDWSAAEWFEAFVGEVGEYANFAKKHRRGDITTAEFMIHARKELADAQIYLDLLAKRLGIDLGFAVQSKFNETSRKVGAPVFLSDNQILMSDPQIKCGS